MAFWKTVKDQAYRRSDGRCECTRQHTRVPAWVGHLPAAEVHHGDRCSNTFERNGFWLHTTEMVAALTTCLTARPCALCARNSRWLTETGKRFGAASLDWIGQNLGPVLSLRGQPRGSGGFVRQGSRWVSKPLPASNTH